MGERAFARIRPIFNEEARFLTNRLKINIPQESCFMENNIIKAFISKDKLINLYMIRINKETLEITLHKVYNSSINEILNWQQVIQLYDMDLKELEEESITTVSKILEQYSAYEPVILMSGGKDSALLTHIVRKVKPTVLVIYNNTTNEVAEHYVYIKSIPNLNIINPNEGLWVHCKKENFLPSRRARECCRIYKHEATSAALDREQEFLLFMGMRNKESSKRSGYGDIHIATYYPKGWIGILPIRKWDTLKVWLYLLKNNIEFNPIYKKGYSRCGCIICPFRRPYEDILTKEYYRWYVERFQKIQESNFVLNKRWIHINCTKKEFIDYAWKGGKARDKPSELAIDEFANHMGLDKEDLSQESTCMVQPYLMRLEK